MDFYHYNIIKCPIERIAKVWMQLTVRTIGHIFCYDKFTKTKGVFQMTERNLTFFQEPVRHGNIATIAKIRAELHEKVVLHMRNFYDHIRAHHPEITIDIIVSILTAPDEVYRKSQNIKEFYYHKTIEGIEYKVVVEKSKKYNRYEVITAYSVWDCQRQLEFDMRKKYCSYSISA